MVSAESTHYTAIQGSENMEKTVRQSCSKALEEVWLACYRVAPTPSVSHHKRPGPEPCCLHLSKLDHRK